MELGTAASASKATERGFNTFFGYLDQDHAHWYYTDYLDDNGGKHVMPHNPKTHEYYSHHLIADRALGVDREHLAEAMVVITRMALGPLAAL